MPGEIPLDLISCYYFYNKKANETEQKSPLHPRTHLWCLVLPPGHSAVTLIPFPNPCRNYKPCDSSPIFPARARHAHLPPTTTPQPLDEHLPATRRSAMGDATASSSSRTAELDAPLHALGFEIEEVSSSRLTGRLIVNPTCFQVSSPPNPTSLLSRRRVCVCLYVYVWPAYSCSRCYTAACQA
jgi:hypothetical protein